MSETNNKADVENSESSTRFIINNMCGSRKGLWFSSNSSDSNSKNIPTNTLIGRKTSCTADN